MPALLQRDHIFHNRRDSFITEETPFARAPDADPHPAPLFMARGLRNAACVTRPYMTQARYTHYIP